MYKRFISGLTTLFLLLSLLLAGSTVQAQDSTQVKSAETPTPSLLHMKDGTVLRGVILSETEEGVRIRTDNLGELFITRDKIDKIEREVAGYYRNGQFWFQNPHSTRYFWAPSALPLRKGEGYYQNAYIFINSVAIGVTDQFSMGAGWVLNPTFRDWQVFFITPKVSFPSTSNVTFGAGMIGVGVFSNRNTYDNRGYVTGHRLGTDLFGIGYGNVTFGNTEKNFTLGLGWGFSNDDIASTPVVNLAYMSRVGRRVGFVTENWLVLNGIDNDPLALLSGGVRFFGEKTSIDLGLWIPAVADMDAFIAIPYVDFVLKFGKKPRRR
ncbi:hypothetical protein [Telluribacter sp. SYSU D00476]|uniref:hypothetical protein n=1 Tax=Telluribacter sp. SYSU D00476 TaxID=2811430 RepID=UPI001FF47C81|nr:hypothetical protein [Telluribacter sp. SYSU D00476]